MVCLLDSCEIFYYIHMFRLSPLFQGRLIQCHAVSMPSWPFWQEWYLTLSVLVLSPLLTAFLVSRGPGSPAQLFGPLCTSSLSFCHIVTPCSCRMCLPFLCCPLLDLSGRCSTARRVRQHFCANPLARSLMC
ncbi:hypothetical protein BDR04DRAFT_665878 [Suillus decipiens]|nr:hypothetical protein BDR04DRAFT_665878 [Suillus decipiens]